MYGWIITKDWLAAEVDGDDEAGTLGPRDVHDSIVERLRRGEGARFRMYDDDGELYYEGRCIVEGDANEVRESAEFPGVCDSLTDEHLGPLNDFGTPNAGCVTIRYFTRHGRLVAL